MRFPLFGLLRRAIQSASYFALFFLCAGRWDLPFAWAYLALWSAYILAGAFGPAEASTPPSGQAGRPTRQDPDLARPAPSARDWLTTAISQLLFWVGLAGAGLDMGRLHWADALPTGLQAAALLLAALSLGLLAWSRASNRFFSSLIRIQRERGHHVVTAGPYRFVRHPGYAGLILFNLLSAMALGSWLALPPFLARALLALRRTAVEDRVLHAELEGYAAYAERVRYRLLPGIW